MAAGSKRRNRRAQKARRRMRPVAVASVSSRVVMRKPDSVKNVLTPRNPPRAQPKPV